MRKVIAMLFLIASFNVSAEITNEMISKQCGIASKIANAIMTGRQKGLSKFKMEDSVKMLHYPVDVQFALNIITAVYVSTPVYESVVDKRKAIDEYTDKIYSGCIERIVTHLR